MGFPATFSRAASDPQWQKAGESLCLQGKAVRGYVGSVEWEGTVTFAQRIPLFQLLLIQKRHKLWCAWLQITQGRLRLKVTKRVLFHWEISEAHLI